MDYENIKSVYQCPQATKVHILYFMNYRQVESSQKHHISYALGQKEGAVLIYKVSRGFFGVSLTIKSQTRNRDTPQRD